MDTYIQERNIALAIIFTIITCGIYGLYWLYKLTEETNELTGHREATGGGMVIVFTIITCGIYGVYWAYKQGEKFRDEGRNCGRNDGEDLPVLYIVLQIANYFVGVTSIVNYALMQDRINQILRRRGAGNWQAEPRYTYRNDAQSQEKSRENTEAYAIPQEVEYVEDDCQE